MVIKMNGQCWGRVIRIAWELLIGGGPQGSANIREFLFRMLPLPWVAFVESLNCSYHSTVVRLNYARKTQGVSEVRFFH